MKSNVTYTYEDFSKVDLKSLKTNELNALANSIREYIIDKCSINGGHLASNLGVVELTIAIHKAFDLSKDKLLFDVGHQAYTHKILTGRSLDNLRCENGVDGFIKRKESSFDHFEAGHSSTSISAAMGMALERDLKNENYEVISLIGDASIANGLAFEALNNVSNFKHKIIIIINDNDMSISQPVGALHNLFQSIRLSSKYLKSKEKYRKFMKKNKFLEGIYNFSSNIKNWFKSLVLHNNVFEMCGFRYIGNIDGYDFKEMEHAFKKAKKSKNSVVIHVSTIKGKGFKYSEDKSSVASWHSVKPFNKETGEATTKINENEISWSKVYATFLDEELANNKDTILINPSTTIGSEIQDLFIKYKNQTFDVGIAEEHALMLAAGYSLNNKHSYVSVYSTFFQRAYDELNHDIARTNANVTILLDRCGLVGKDGETHQGIFDESLIMGLDNVTLTMAKDLTEAKFLFDLSKTINAPYIIRIPSGKTNKEINENRTYVPFKWIKEKESSSNKLVVISLGPKVNDILNNFKELDFTLINALFIKPLDIESLKSILNFENIIIYNPYSLKEGFAYEVLGALNNLNYKGNIKIISLNNSFIEKGTIEEQEKRCKVHLDDLKKEIISLL